MVRKITLQGINELTKNYRLQDITPIPQPWLMDETVQPIIDLDPVLRQWKSNRYSMAGWTPPVEVPLYFLLNGEKWLLHAIWWNRASGDATFNKLGVRLSNSPGWAMWFYQFASAASGSYFLPHPIQLNEGDVLSLYADGGTAMSSVDFVVLIEIISNKEFIY